MLKTLAIVLAAAILSGVEGPAAAQSDPVAAVVEKAPEAAPVKKTGKRRVKAPPKEEAKVEAPAEIRAGKAPRRSRKGKELSEKKTAVDEKLGPPQPTVEAPVVPPPPPEPVVVIPVLDVVWPKEKDAFPYVTRSFVFGKANSGAALTINGQTVQVLPSGAFFAMVPFSTGTFNLDFESKFSGVMVSTRRVVQVAPQFGPEPDPGTVLALAPSEDVEVRPGELLVVRCKGPTGGQATFSIGKAARDLAMPESTGTLAGLYEGQVYIPTWAKRDPLEVECKVKAKKGGKAKAAGKVTILDPLQTGVAVTTSRNTIVKSADAGYTIFLPAGVRLETLGKRGGSVRVRLTESLDGWIDAKLLAFQPAGSPPPRATVGRYISTKASDRSVRVVVSASERVAYEVSQTVEPLGFTVRFFNSNQRFDRTRFGEGDTVVRDVRWSQESGEVVKLDVDTRMQWGWGYAAGYDESGNFFLEIRRPPDLTRGDNVFAGRRIVIDPGHGPETSAVGPLGTTERDVNLAIGFALENLLTSEGAEAVLTRRNVDGPALGERPWIAQEAKGDLFVSIHNNALPVTADPAEAPRGYMHFYYHPQSRRLAEAVEGAYRKRHPDLPDEGLRWGDLAVCRGTFMPAILTESAYVILPEQEDKLRSPYYQKRLAGSLLEGMRDYLKDYQRLQKRLPEEKAAATGK